MIDWVGRAGVKKRVCEKERERGRETGLHDVCCLSYRINTRERERERMRQRERERERERMRQRERESARARARERE